MAIHNFNYTYSYDSAKSTPKNHTDNTQIIREITLEITAVDQADSSKTLTLKQTKVPSYAHLTGDATLPDSFIQIENITNQQMIDWYKIGLDTNVLDAFFTWKLYGVEELDL
jgi:hypothetical protein